MSDYGEYLKSITLDYTLPEEASMTDRTMTKEEALGILEGAVRDGDDDADYSHHDEETYSARKQALSVLRAALAAIPGFQAEVDIRGKEVLRFMREIAALKAASALAKPKVNRKDLLPFVDTITLKHERRSHQEAEEYAEEWLRERGIEVEGEKP